MSLQGGLEISIDTSVIYIGIIYVIEYRLWIIDLIIFTNRMFTISIKFQGEFTRSSSIVVWPRLSFHKGSRRIKSTSVQLNSFNACSTRSSVAGRFRNAPLWYRLCVACTTTATSGPRVGGVIAGIVGSASSMGVVRVLPVRGSRWVTSSGLITITTWSTRASTIRALPP